MLFKEIIAVYSENRTKPVGEIHSSWVLNFLVGVRVYFKELK
jgi:hypothetical protein